MKKNKVLIYTGVAIIFLILLSIGYFILRMRDNHSDLPSEIEKVGSIDGYEYNLEDRDTKLFKDNFEKLKDILEKEDVDFEEYASYLAKLYIIDLYTINNKVNKYDVGGNEYVYPEVRDNYVLKVEDTLYKYLEDNSYGKRDQDLPEVVDIKVDNIEPESIEVLNKKYEGYILELSWEYKKDLGYDSYSKVEIIKVDDKLYVVSQSVSED